MSAKRARSESTSANNYLTGARQVGQYWIYLRSGAFDPPTQRATSTAMAIIHTVQEEKLPSYFVGNGIVRQQVKTQNLCVGVRGNVVNSTLSVTAHNILA